MIVPEVLKEDNYERWCIFMQHYLVAQDLWDVVLSNEMLHGEDSRESIKRNALALHTIKISCGAKKFDAIKEMNSAKDAWNALADLYKQPNGEGNKDTGIKTDERKQACIFVQSNAGVAACMIVPEVLKEDNYEKWRIFMEHYLVAQDLWDVVLSSKMPNHGEDSGKWIKRNASALHAIKISCGTEQFDRIKKLNSAKDVWNALADLHKRPNDTGIRTIERKQAVTLLKDIRKGNSAAVKELFETHSQYSAALIENGSTALHVAITAGKIELAKELISVMSEEQLETKDKSGKTALSLAACKGSTEIVECLVAKNKKLLEMPDCEKKIPLVLACATHHKCLTLYLYSVTPIEILDPVNGDHLFFLLRECLRNHMFDIGLNLLSRFPDLIFHKSSLEPTPIISELVQMLSPLFAGIWYKPLPFWEWPFGGSNVQIS
ncbi:hypothetical protein SLEP1_g55870 [Rubroshorea leprosula]|uniref:DUF4219 domain-containing protein n=1 Tax=Rubroshorea leprosula TaxID=152421 RepID=A0AAV5MGN4_9ROSI|nr:hypothetical protein SLEP1_g55870 [Rubroshorea leprosula]